MQLLWVIYFDLFIPNIILNLEKEVELLSDSDDDMHKDGENKNIENKTKRKKTEKQKKEKEDDVRHNNL